MREIASRQNPTFRRLMAVSRESGAAGRESVMLEGFRLCRDAILSGVQVECLVFSESTDPGRRDELMGLAIDGTDAILLPDSLFRSIASTVSPQGAACVFKHPDAMPMATVPAAGTRYLVLENVQDPGNVGAMIRTADAMGFDGVIILPGTADPFRPKSIRSAMGSTFHLPIIQGDSIEQAVAWLHGIGCTVYAAHLVGKALERQGLAVPGALLIGNEGAGLSDAASTLADHLVRIPMAGRAESLNASCAAAILCYSMHIDHLV